MTQIIGFHQMEQLSRKNISNTVMSKKTSVESLKSSKYKILLVIDVVNIVVNLVSFRHD
jgi:hypothetical protein